MTSSVFLPLRQALVAIALVFLTAADRAPKPSDTIQTPDLAIQEAERTRSAAVAGDRDAQFSLGELYYRIGRNTEAARWFRSAAQQNHPIAMSRLRTIESAVSVPQGKAYLILRAPTRVWIALTQLSEKQ